MLIIDNAFVSELLSMEDCIRVQDEAFRALATGAAMHRPRVDMYVPCERPDGYFRWGTMEGANGGYFAIRMKSDIITWPKDRNGNWTEEKYCREAGTYCGLILLVSTRNAEPLAFINDGVLQHMRVGGGAGLGAKYLSRPDSPRRRHARLGRHGPHLSRSVPMRARRAPVQGVQPDGGAPRGLCRGDVAAPQHRGSRRR